MAIPFLLTVISIFCAAVGVWAIFAKLLPLLNYVEFSEDTPEEKEKKFSVGYSSFFYISFLVGLGSLLASFLFTTRIEEKVWCGWIMGVFLIIGLIVEFVFIYWRNKIFFKKHQIGHKTTFFIRSKYPIFFIVISVGGALYNIIYFIRCFVLGLF